MTTNAPGIGGWLARPTGLALLHAPVFVALGLVFTLFPEIDLKVSRLFFDPTVGRWLAGGQAWVEAVRLLLTVEGAAVPAGAVALFFYGRRVRRRVPGGDGRIAVYLLLCLALGPGLLVNGVLKASL